MLSYRLFFLKIKIFLKNSGVSKERLLEKSKPRHKGNTPSRFPNEENNEKEVWDMENIE